MSETSSLNHKEQQHPLHGKTSHFSKFKRRLAAVKQEWGPLLPAKTHWDDEYNFNPGPWAGKACTADVEISGL
ncbi:hypothetical protein BJX99DRAFT_252793 [Aspergillus californicus]